MQIVRWLPASISKIKNKRGQAYNLFLHARNDLMSISLRLYLCLFVRCSVCLFLLPLVCIFCFVSISLRESVFVFIFCLSVPLSTDMFVFLFFHLIALFVFPMCSVTVYSLKLGVSSRFCVPLFTVS